MFAKFKVRLLQSGMLFSALIAGGNVTAAEKPNIVLFVADDFGRGSINTLGADEKFVKTPNLNTIAKEGINFTNAFTTASVCTPTRYTMLTGQYSWRTHLKMGVVNNSDPLLISTKTETIGKWLQKRGYKTAHVGKWHLGYKDKKFDNLLGTIKPGPIDVGFDYHFGVPNNLDDLHKVYIENDHIFGLRSDKIEAWGKSFYRDQKYKGYDAPQRKCDEVMEYTTRKAIDWINDVAAQDKPFFLYYGAVAVHHPIKPSKRMKGTSGAGLYGDFIHDVDYAVGQFMNALKEKGLDKNTLFIFTSDNGGDIPSAPNQLDWPEAKALRMGFNFNGDNRGDKHTIWEGGLKVPFIVRWPAQVAGESESEELVTTADIYGTIAEAVEGKLPAPEEAAPDSFSFYSILKDSKTKSNRPFLVHRNARGLRAMRKGKWKFINNFYPAREDINVKSKTKGPKMLFDLSKDPMEENNVIKQFPEVAKELEELLQEATDQPSTRRMTLGQSR